MHFCRIRIYISIESWVYRYESSYLGTRRVNATNIIWPIRDSIDEFRIIFCVYSMAIGHWWRIIFYCMVFLFILNRCQSVHNRDPRIEISLCPIVISSKVHPIQFVVIMKFYTRAKKKTFHIDWNTKTPKWMCN